MHDFPFDNMDLDVDEVEALQATYKILKSKFNICLPSDADKHINKFELFNNVPGNSIGGTLLINYPKIDCYLNFVKRQFDYSYGGRGGKGGQNFTYFKYQIWAFVNSKTDFGRVLIRRETFTDKVLEMVNHTELKFKDDAIFNKYFYVIANNEELARNAMTPDFRKLLIDMMYNDYVIETINKTLVIRTNQPVTPEETVRLTELANKIAELA